MTIQIRKSGDRAYFDYGWLKTFHTFSFGPYQDQDYRGFRSLRVINEDCVSPGVGFPLHSNQDMEMFSIVIEGGLSHQDDLGNGSILRPGHIQLLSAGRGITHSELNASDKEEVHLLQMWILPIDLKLNPSYQEKFFPPSTWHNCWGLIISHDGREGSLYIHQNVDVYLVTLEPEKELNYSFKENRDGWIQIMNGVLDIDGITLETGDGAAISQLNQFRVKAQSATQFVFLDLN